jgi:hypothetical protein
MFLDMHAHYLPIFLSPLPDFLLSQYLSHRRTHFIITDIIHPYAHRHKAEGATDDAEYDNFTKRMRKE